MNVKCHSVVKLHPLVRHAVLAKLIKQQSS